MRALEEILGLVICILGGDIVAGNGAQEKR